MTGPTSAGAAVLGSTTCCSQSATWTPQLTSTTAGSAWHWRSGSTTPASPCCASDPKRQGLLIRRADASQVTGGGRVWLEVRDAHAVATALADVPGRGEPFQVATGWTVEVADPWGNTVGFTDYTMMPQRGRP